MSTLSDLLPAGSGGKNVDFVASGALSNGQTVGLKSDGTVEAIAGTGNLGYTSGSVGVFESSYVYNVNAVYESVQQKVVVFYADSGNFNYGTGEIGTVSGKTISFSGSPFVFETSSLTQDGFIASAYHAHSGTILVAFGTAGKARAITISGNTGTVSASSYTFSTYGAVQGISVTYDENALVGIIAYVDRSGGYDAVYAKCAVISGSGTGASMTFGAQQQISYNENSSYVAVKYGTGLTGNDQRGIVGWRNTSLSPSSPCHRSFSVSGTTITVHTLYITTSVNSIYQTLGFDSTEGKYLFGWYDATNDRGSYVTLKPSGSNTTAGTITTFDTASPSYLSFAYDTVGQNNILFYSGSPSYTKLKYVLIPSSTLVSGTPVEVISSGTGLNSAVYVPSQGFVNSFRLASPQNGQSIVLEYGFDTNNSTFIGVTDAAIANTATGSVTIKGGIVTNASLPTLTPNSVYYVQANGTINTTTTSPAVRIGKALSSTSINLEFNS